MRQPENVLTDNLVRYQLFFQISVAHGRKHNAADAKQMLKHNHHQQQFKRFGVHLLADDFRVQKILGFVNHHQKYQ